MAEGYWPPETVVIYYASVRWVCVRVCVCSRAALRMLQGGACWDLGDLKSSSSIVTSSSRGTSALLHVLQLSTNGELLPYYLGFDSLLSGRSIVPVSRDWLRACAAP